MDNISPIFSHSAITNEYEAASAILIGIVCAYSGSPLWIWAILGYTLMLDTTSNLAIKKHTVAVLLFNIPFIRRNLVSKTDYETNGGFKFHHNIRNGELQEMPYRLDDGELFSGNQF